MREGDDDAVAAADESDEVALGLGEAAGRHGRALGLERVRLAARELVELDGTGQGDRLGDGLLLPDLPDLGRLPDEVGGRERRDEVVRDGDRRVVVRERRLHEVGAALGGRMDPRGVEGAERSLREGRERADRLDLVAEELEADRLPARRGEDVDDAAADSELAAFLDAIDPGVAGEGEVLGEAVGAGLVADLEDERRGPRVGRRHPVGDAERRGADEPAAGEDLERTRALADEVRRGLEPGLPADAAGGEQPDVLLAEEPGRGLGGVPGVVVVGQQADERAFAGEPERREEERQDRLGHARAAWGLHERAQALARARARRRAASERVSLWRWWSAGPWRRRETGIPRGREFYGAAMAPPGANLDSGRARRARLERLEVARRRGLRPARRGRQRSTRWQAEHAEALASVPPEAMRVEYGRRGEGLYVRVRIEESKIPPALQPEPTAPGRVTLVTSACAIGRTTVPRHGMQSRHTFDRESAPNRGQTPNDGR